MPASFSVEKLNFKKVKINKDKTLEVIINMGTDEQSYTLIAPDGYYIVDPDTGLNVKQLYVQGGNFLITNENDKFATNDGDNILIVTEFGTYVLTDDGGFILTDDSLKIDYVE